MPRSIVVVAVTIIALLIVGDLHSQSRRLYYNKYWELTVPDSAWYYRDCEIDTINRTFSGSFIDYYADGVKQMEGSYISGKKSGAFSSWFHNGQLESRGNFVDKIQTGIWKYYYPDGRDRQEVRFDGGGFTVISFYDSTGRQTVAGGTGHWYEYYEEYNLDGLLLNEGDFTNGKKDGDWATAFNGIIIVKEKFNKGKFRSGVQMDGKATRTLQFEVNNKLLPHYKFSITEKWQKDKNPKTGEQYPFLFFGETRRVLVEHPAEFPGGMGAMYKFIEENRVIPKAARKSGVNGRVMVSFNIDKDGTISNVAVAEGLGYGCDEEAVRIVSKFPKWKPGFQNGKAVKSKFILPIKFKT
jgi:TonB family protein